MLSMSTPLDEENGSSKDINALDKMGLHSLDQKFRDDIGLLFYKVFQETPIKQMMSKPIRGAVLADLLEEYIDGLNKSNVANVS